MYDWIPHECGGRAYVVGGKLVYGWNQYCCGRCAEVFWKFVTKEMLEQYNNS